MENIGKFKFEYDWLSNDHPATFYHDGIKYKSVTHAYHSLKIKNENNAKKVRECDTASNARKLARTFDVREDFQSICKELMLKLLRKKFESPFLADKLVKTGTKILGEKNSFTGELLMKVRKEIIDDQRKNSKFV